MKHKHTGRIRHHDMVMLHGSRGHGKKDPHAEAMYHEMNKKHGMAHGMSPANDSDDTGEGSQGGAGMAGNAECCE